jgi:hypothetical protein
MEIKVKIPINNGKTRNQEHPCGKLSQTGGRTPLGKILFALPLKHPTTDITQKVFHEQADN